MRKYNFINGKENRKQLFVVIFALLFLLTSFSIVIAKERTINVIDGSHVFSVPVKSQTVAELLNEQGLKLSTKDQINVNLSEKTESVNEVIIDRAIKVNVSVDGITNPLHTRARIVSEVLSECGISLSNDDIVTPDKDAAVSNGMTISVTHRETKTESTLEAIAFSSVSKQTSSLVKGTKKVTQKGQNGVRKLTYEIMYQNGKEISRNLVSNVVVMDAVNEITEIGTATKSSNYSVATNGAKPFNYKRVLSFRATAYDPSCGSITASGRRAKKGIVAVDTSVIPLGTHLYIESADGGKSWVYGYCIAGDTGGAIKNNKVDLFFNSRSEAVAFGVSNATIYVLD